MAKLRDTEITGTCKVTGTPSDPQHVMRKGDVDDRRFAANIGNGTATTINVTHNLNTLDPIVQVRMVADPKEVVTCDVTVTSANAVQLLFDAAPAANAMRVIILS